MRFYYSLLSPKCISVARPTLFGYIDTREEFEYYAQKLFDMITVHKLRINIHGIYPLEEVQQAHKVRILRHGPWV